jgi:hypothetical protein
VFTSPTLATDLSQLHCNLKSHVKSSLHYLFFFFFVISSQSSSAAISRTRTNSNSSCVRSSLYVLEADRQKTPLPLLLQRSVESAVAWQQKLYNCCLCIRCRGNVFTESLASNGYTRHSIIYNRMPQIKKIQFNNIHERNSHCHEPVENNCFNNTQLISSQVPTDSSTTGFHTKFCMSLFFVPLSCTSSSTQLYFFWLT